MISELEEINVHSPVDTAAEDVDRINGLPEFGVRTAIGWLVDQVRAADTSHMDDFSAKKAAD